MTFDACSPAWVTHPPTSCSTSAGIDARPLHHLDLGGGEDLGRVQTREQPLRFPIGVRTASTITGFAMTQDSRIGSTSMGTATTGPLAGLKVIELVGLGPGPFAGMLLADMGAEVLRIDRLDEARAARSRRNPRRAP